MLPFGALRQTFRGDLRNRSHWIREKQELYVCLLDLIYYVSAGDAQLEGAGSALLPCVSVAEVFRLGGRLAHPKLHIL